MPLQTGGTGIPGLYPLYEDSPTWLEIFGKHRGEIGILSANRAGTPLFYARHRNDFRRLGSLGILFVLSI